MNRSILLLSMLAATGCTSGKGGFLSGFVPSVEFERLEVIDIDFEHVETDFVFNIDNPNPVGFRIDSFNYALSFADVEFVTGDNPDGLVLNPDNDSEATLPTNIVFLDIYDMVQAARGDDHIGFGVEGDFGIRLSSDTVILEEEEGGDTAEGQAGSSSVTEDEDGYVVNLPYDAGGDFPALRKPNFSFRKIKVTDWTLDSLNFALKFDVDNEHASNLTFTRFAYDLSLGGGEAISGVVDNLEEIISGSEPEDGINPSSVENKILSIPIEINNLEVVSSLLDLILNNNKLDIQFGAATDVDTPFGLVELSIDEQGEIDVEVN